MKRFAIFLVVILGFAALYNQMLRHNRNLELDRRLAVEAELRRIEVEAENSISPSELIKQPPLLPIEQIYIPPQVMSPPADRRTADGDFSERLERDQMRREIDALKRQADLEQMNRDMERQEDRRRANRTERERYLGLDVTR